MAQKPKIQISDRLKKFLDDNSTHKNQTYEDIIWLLLGTKTLTKEQKDYCKEAYEDALQIKMKIVKDYVELVLKENEEARNNDFVLCLNVYVKMGYAKKLPLGILINYKNIESAPAFETITRIRREIQNEENRLMPNKETRDKRIRVEKEYKEAHKINKLNYTTMPNSHLSWY